MKTVIVDKNKQSSTLIEVILKEINQISEIILLEDFNFETNNVDLIIFDINSENADEIIKNIKKIKEENQEIKLIATSYEINSNLASSMLSLGVNDFLIKPIIAPILKNSIEKLNILKNNKAKTMAVFSNKGGVGKTSFAVNLAFELYKKTDKKVCILDLSLNYENAIRFLNIKKEIDALHVFNNIEKSNKELLLSLISKYRDTKLYVLEITQENISKGNISKERISSFINALKNIFDYIIIDTTNIMNEFNIFAMDNCDIVFLIDVLNNYSIKNLQKSYEEFDKIGYNDDKIKLIINRYSNMQEKEYLNFKNAIKKDIFEKIPNNYLTMNDAISCCKPLDELHPHSNIAKAYSNLAQKILEIDFDKFDNKGNLRRNAFDLLKRIGEE